MIIAGNRGGTIRNSQSAIRNPLIVGGSTRVAVVARLGIVAIASYLVVLWIRFGSGVARQARKDLVVARIGVACGAGIARVFSGSNREPRMIEASLIPR